MDSKIKNILGIIVGITLLVAMGSMITYSKAFKQSLSDSVPSFSVSAEGAVVGVPDVAVFTFTVLSEGDGNLVELQTENSKAMAQAIDFLKDNDIEKEDIKTISYNLSPRYTYFPCKREANSCPPSKITGYSIRQSTQVKVKNLEKAGELLAGVVNNGANSVSQLTFSIDDSDRLKNQAREEAFDKAKNKAKSLAKAGNFRLGRVLSVQEGTSSRYPVPYAYDAGFGGVLEKESVPIEQGSQDVIVSITIQYEIK